MKYQRSRRSLKHRRKSFRHKRSFGKYRSASHQFLSDLKATGRQFNRSFKKTIHSTKRRLSNRLSRRKKMPVHNSLTMYNV